jgi:hypothetical protein
VVMMASVCPDPKRRMWEMASSRSSTTLTLRTRSRNSRP